jgi:hypothetical protein
LLAELQRCARTDFTQETVDEGCSLLRCVECCDAQGSLLQFESMEPPVRAIRQSSETGKISLKNILSFWKESSEVLLLEDSSSEVPSIRLLTEK